MDEHFLQIILLFCIFLLVLASGIVHYARDILDAEIWASRLPAGRGPSPTATPVPPNPTAVHAPTVAALSRDTDASVGRLAGVDAATLCDARPWPCDWALAVVACESSGRASAWATELYDADGDGIKERWYFSRTLADCFARP